MLNTHTKFKGLVPVREFDKGWKGTEKKNTGERNWNPEKYFEDLQIPDTWKDVEEFANWYMSNRMPWMVPWDAEVIVSDDATAITLFRHDRFMVELYLVHPDMAIPTHCHPNMESVIIRLGAGNLGRKHPLGVSDIWGAMAPVLYSGEYHGGRPLGFSPKGYAMLTFEHWTGTEEMSSAAVLWKGDTAGPKQDALIRAHTPNVFVTEGYADCTQGPDGSKPTGSASKPLMTKANEFLPMTDLGGSNG
jgi:hypothetical protein